MAVPTPRVRILRQRTAVGGWELAIGAPDPGLAPFVHGPYCGYTETAAGPARRREVAWPYVVIIIDFGPTLRILDADTEALAGCHRLGFVAGVGERYTLMETQGGQRGLQINLTPLGAYRCFGLSMAELTNRIVDLDDAFGADGPRLAHRLEALPSWEARFALVDDVLRARIAARDACAGVAWACGRIAASGGRLEIGALADELGYSHRLLIARFREQVGVPPKMLARLTRFDGVMRRLKAGPVAAWSQLALDAGYYDQAHMIRDFRQFTGASPSAFVASWMPEVVVPDL